MNESGAPALTMLVMRHSKAEPVAATDHVRRLTDRGRTDARAAGAWVAASGFVPDLILASTAARAEETAELVASRAGVRRLEFVDELYGADGYEVIDVVAERAPAEVGTAMVVGHNPAMAELGLLLQHEGAEALRFPTSGIGVFALDVETWADLEAGRGRALASYPPD
jgi:phosphohistidine phosphatase